jgi:phosphopantothenoylcysteine synthetase/decarboxylase
MTPGVLYIIACAAPPAADVGKLVQAAKREGWDTCALTTPSALRFVNQLALEELTGHEVRSQYKEPGTPDLLPPPDAIIVAPATVNTINKWALGICDTLALGLLVEGIGKKLPIVALPFTNHAHAAHPAFAESISKLRSWGVQVLFGSEVYPLHAPGTGSQHLGTFPWRLTLKALSEARFGETA